MPRAVLSVSYVRRWFDGFTVADNRSLAPSDLTPFTLTAPMDDRLPGGSGYPIGGLYDIVPGKAGQVSNLITSAGNYGDWYQSLSGVDVTLNARFGNRFTAVGGTSTGQTVADNCGVRERLPELSTTTTGTSVFGAGLNASAVTPVSPYCHVASGVLTQFRGFASYIVPKMDVQLSAVVLSKPGALLAANYTAHELRKLPRRSGERLGQRRQRHRQLDRAGHVARGSHQRARFPDRQDPQARGSSNTPRHRRLQCAQFQRRPHL